MYGDGEDSCVVSCSYDTDIESFSLCTFVSCSPLLQGSETSDSWGVIYRRSRKGTLSEHCSWKLFSRPVYNQNYIHSLIYLSGCMNACRNVHVHEKRWVYAAVLICDFLHCLCFLYIPLGTELHRKISKQPCEDGHYLRVQS